MKIESVNKSFKRTVCSMWSNVLFEIVRHEGLTEADITKFFAEYFEFSTAGWRKLMKV